MRIRQKHVCHQFDRGPSEIPRVQYGGFHDRTSIVCCKLRALPADTLVCSGHEYTASNARFALTVEPGNAALSARTKDIAAKRARGEATVPSLLSEEIATNPFLRADLPEVKAAIGMAGASDVAVFAEIRGRKDRF